ncbi:MAG: hypothetical protein M3430_09860 [Acidobacteriota bacterium]|nr:hypothetical protein [Acidobacteriota bacterium]
MRIKDRTLFINPHSAIANPQITASQTRVVNAEMGNWVLVKVVTDQSGL